MTAVQLPLGAGGREEHEFPASARLRASAPRTHVLEQHARGPAVVRSVLPGGTRVLTETMPAQRSATVGFWIGLGSRDEVPGMLGATHFLEHLLFKGTARRTALQIAEAFDRVGGESNAFTAKEHTCYYARVLSEQLPMAVDVLADMFCDAVLDPEEFDRERGVILEEIAMDRDDPADFAFEQFEAAVFHGSPLARPIAGTPDEIRRVRRDAVWEHYRRAYRPANLVVTAAGGLEHEDVVATVTAALERTGVAVGSHARGTAAARRPRTPLAVSPRAGTRVFHRPVEQAHVVVGGPGLPVGDEHRFTMRVLDAALGGGMSSRLFRTIREQKGLAYSTFSFAGSYSDAGYFGMYAGCTPDRTDAVARLMREELDRLAQDGPDGAELAKIEGQLTGATVLALEEPEARMSRLGAAEVTTGEYMDVDESLERIRAVTSEDVRTLAARLSAAATVHTVVGPDAADRKETT